MDSSMFKKSMPIVLLMGLGGMVMKTQFPQYLPMGFGGSTFSPLETKARHYAQTAGQTISSNCNNSGNKPKVQFIGFQSLKNDRLKIHLEVKWEGMLGMSYHVKGWATCDENGVNPHWQKEDNSSLLIPGCYSDLGESLE